MPANQREDHWQGAVRVNGAAGSFAFSTSLFASILRTSVGVWEISLVGGANSNECTIRTQVIASSAVKRTLAVEWASNTLIRIRATGVT